MVNHTAVHQGAIRRAAAMAVLVLGSIGGLAACSDDAGLGSGDENVPLPPNSVEDSGDDFGDESDLDGDRPGLGGEPDSSGADIDSGSGDGS